MFDLTGLTILVVEDEFFLADEIASALSAVGAQVAGPAGSVAAAMKIVEGDTMLHAALLDVNLVGEKVFSVADSLLQRGTPFVFATGYDADVIPERHRGTARIAKPAAVEQIIRALISATSEHLSHVRSAELNVSIENAHKL